MIVKASNKYYILILLMIFPFFGFSQIVDYSSSLIKANKIKSFETYEIYGFASKKLDTSKTLKIDFDTLGRVIKKEEDFNKVDSPQIRTVYFYHNSKNRFDEIEKINSIKETKNQTIKFEEIKDRHLNSKTEYSMSSKVLKRLTNYENGLVELSKYYYNKNDILILQEDYRNDVLYKKIVIKILY